MSDNVRIFEMVKLNQVIKSFIFEYFWTALYIRN